MSEYYPFRHEASGDDNDTESKPSKKKGKAAISTLGGLTAEKLVQKDNEKDTHKEKTAEAEPSLWQRLMADDKEAEPKEPSAGTDKAETAKSPEVPLEQLSPAEAHEAVRQYAEAQLATVHEEAAQANSTSSETAEAVAAADIALLESIREKLAAEPDRPITEILDEAEAEATQQIVEGAPEADVLPDEQSEAEAMAEAGEIPLRPDAEDTTLVIRPTPISPAAGSGGAGGTGRGGNGGGAIPPLPPIPVGPTGSGPFYGGAGAPSGPTGGGAPRFNTAPAMAARTPEMNMEDERRIIARGLLVGGIVGYFIGRRRGRIKTEKRLLPIQKKLEKQVTTLTSAVAAKEQVVRKLAAERATMTPTPAGRREFIDRLSRPESRATQGATAEYRPSGRIPRPRAERLGRVLVEAPSTVLGGSMASRPERAAESVGPIIDFNKKVENYTTAELTRAAEKIRVDGVTLKELYGTHNLDEKALRRVVTAFVEGRSVRAALNHELLEHERRYERDPKMRGGRPGGSRGAGATTSVAAVAGLAVLSHESQMAGSDGGVSGAQPAARPTPDKKTLDRLRKQQITQVTTLVTVVLVLMAIILVALLG